MQQAAGNAFVSRLKLRAFFLAPVLDRNRLKRHFAASPTQRRFRHCAFTLTELLVSIGIIAILATLTVQGYSKVAASVAKGKCIANLRNLHVAFATYVQDNGYWPQQPDFESAYSQQYQDWWLNTMDPYTKSREVWKCPLLKKYGAYDSGGKKLEIHYTPTRFDARPTTPYRWAEAALAHRGEQYPRQRPSALDAGWERKEPHGSGAEFLQDEKLIALVDHPFSCATQSMAKRTISLASLNPSLSLMWARCVSMVFTLR